MKKDLYCIEKEEGLIDDCKYILYIKDGYTVNGYQSMPCRTKKEALHFIKEIRKEEE